MYDRGEYEISIKKSFFAILIFIVLLSFPFELSAKVTGSCANCHTMHNSQGGSSDPNGPNSGLLKNLSGSVDICVGCHSSTVPNETIKKLNGSDIPIVFNTTAYPDSPLAGGNFYYVSLGGSENDQYGHNVYGISGADNNLKEQAPGTISACETDACHVTLAVSDNSRHKPGCQGCHQRLFHHVESNETSSNTSYRFLWGHDIENLAYVQGNEDEDWEDTKSSTDHNYYKGTTDTYSSGGSGLKNKHTITAFCSGCHVEFHGPYQALNSHDGMGSSSPWMRHPTDIALIQDPLDPGEFAGYNTYNLDAPVAFTNPEDKPASMDTAVVMCLSCHRAHGSDQPDMLRWKYSGIDSVCKAGTPNGDCGCFACHTEKDGA